MREVTIVKPCRYTHPDGHVEVLGVGPHEMTDEMADHWFIRAHSSEPPPRIPPTAGTPEYARLAQERIHRDRLLEMSAQQRAEAAGFDAHDKAIEANAAEE